MPQFIPEIANSRFSRKIPFQIVDHTLKVTAVGYLLMKEYSHYLDLHRDPSIDDRSGHNFFLAGSARVLDYLSGTWIPGFALDSKLPI